MAAAAAEQRRHAAAVVAAADVAAAAERDAAAVAADVTDCSLEHMRCFDQACASMESTAADAAKKAGALINECIRRGLHVLVDQFEAQANQLLMAAPKP
eukprot:jgi/Chlat1/2074/Chrsp17S02770